MKSILITFDQAYEERIATLLKHHNCRGYSQIERITGQGSKSGNPHLGDHAWPSLNSAIITIVPDERVDPLLKALHEIDLETEQLGLRAFVWNIEKTI